MLILKNLIASSTLYNTNEVLILDTTLQLLLLLEVPFRFIVCIADETIVSDSSNIVKVVYILYYLE